MRQMSSTTASRVVLEIVSYAGGMGFAINEQRVPISRLCWCQRVIYLVMSQIDYIIVGTNGRRCLQRFTGKIQHA